MWCILTEQHLSVLEGDGKYKNVTGEFCLAENPNDLWHSNTHADVLQALGGDLCKAGTKDQMWKTAAQNVIHQLVATCRYESMHWLLDRHPAQPDHCFPESFT